MAKAIFRSPSRFGSTEMLLFIVFSLLVILTKSQIPFLASEGGFRFDAAVAIAGLLSFIGLVSYVWWPRRTTGRSFDCSRQDTAVAEWHFETTELSRQGIPVRPVGRPIDPLDATGAAPESDPPRRERVSHILSV